MMLINCLLKMQEEGTEGVFTEETYAHEVSPEETIEELLERLLMDRDSSNQVAYCDYIELRLCIPFKRRVAPVHGRVSLPGTFTEVNDE